VTIAPAPRAQPAESPPPPSPGDIVASAPAAPAVAANQPQAATSGLDNETSVTEMVVAADQRKPREAPAPVAVSAFTSSRRDLMDGGGRLRSAAAAGRTAEVQALLDHGVPVDAPDSDGDTALMKSIQADQRAAAALLRRHGASLDHRNSAGESARDLATAKGDAALDQAIGLGP
jgi:ankyrin repeat protein